MEKGFIKLFHKFCEWEWYDNPNVKILFIHLLLKANVWTKQWQGITIKRGQLITSVEKLAVANGLTTQQIRTALKNLQTTKEIEIETTKKYSIITIKNYNLYQELNKQITKSKPSDNGHDGSVDFSNLTNKQQSANKVINKQITKSKPSDNGHDGSVDFSNLTNKLTTTKDRRYINTSINISSSSSIENFPKITEEEEELLKNHSKKNKIRYFKPWLRKILTNGDYVDILELEKAKQAKAEEVKKEKEKEQIPKESSPEEVKRAIKNAYQLMSEESRNAIEVRRKRRKNDRKESFNF